MEIEYDITFCTEIAHRQKTRDTEGLEGSVKEGTCMLKLCRCASGCVFSPHLSSIDLIGHIFGWERRCTFSSRAPAGCPKQSCTARAELERMFWTSMSSVELKHLPCFHTSVKCYIRQLVKEGDKLGQTSTLRMGLLPGKRSLGLHC